MNGDVGGQVLDPCPQCGGLVIWGWEPIDSELDDPEDLTRGETRVASEWCTNLACPSNHMFPSLRRVGVSTYICKQCQRELSGPISVVLAHPRSHTVDPESPGG